jgi:hypothetical protein
MSVHQHPWAAGAGVLPLHPNQGPKLGLIDWPSRATSGPEQAQQTLGLVEDATTPTSRHLQGQLLRPLLAVLSAGVRVLALSRH